MRTGVINEPAFVALREEEPRRDVGKVGNSRVKEVRLLSPLEYLKLMYLIQTRKNTPYSKEKPARVRKASKTKVRSSASAKATCLTPSLEYTHLHQRRPRFKHLLT